MLALLVEIPGDGNSTQGSMPSHMHTRDDLDYSRGYIWWMLTRGFRNAIPHGTLDGFRLERTRLGRQRKILVAGDAADYYVKMAARAAECYLRPGIECHRLPERERESTKTLPRSCGRLWTATGLTQGEDPRLRQLGQASKWDWSKDHDNRSGLANSRRYHEQSYHRRHARPRRK